MRFIRYKWEKWKESELMVMDEEQQLRAERQNKLIPFHWEGKEQTHEASFKIGFILDLDEGTLNVLRMIDALEQ